MVLARVAANRDRLRSELAAALGEEHPANDVAASFAIGVGITTLPTLGVGLLAFVAIAHLWPRVSKLALFASVLVLNPVAKWGVYGASYWLGTFLLGPVPGIAVSEVSLSAGRDVVLRLLVGNFLLAALFTVVGYVVALGLVRGIRERDIDVGELLADSRSE